MKKNEPTLVERALFMVSPKLGEAAYVNRMKRAGAGTGAKGPQMSTGYGNHGASRTLNSMIGWLAGGGSAEDDIDQHGAILRQRARDLYAGGGLARGGPATLTTNVVGWGIQAKPKIDGELLGMSDEACDEWERAAIREFRLWAENVMCDAERRQNFYGLQQLAFRSMLMSGDVFAMFAMTDNPRTPYQTAVRLLEADRISTPDGMPGESEIKEAPGGGRIVDGVEIDRNGAVVKYHIASRHPLSGDTMEQVKWTAVEAIGRDSGYPNMLHVMTHERPEQRRGIPFVSAQMEQIKQLDRYITSELAANVVASMLTTFLYTETDDGKMGLDDAVNDNEKVTEDELKLEMAPGAIYSLPPGKKVHEVNPIRNNAAFENFVEAMQVMIGSSMEIPKEVLTHRYDRNYTAARGALLDFWKTVRVYRTAFNEKFCQPIYEQWLSEAVAVGRLDAPGFFDDPAIRQAWCGCLWMGASIGHVDPMKEVNAAEKRIALNITTQEQEASEYNGNDWNANVRQRLKEQAALQELEGGETNGEGTVPADDQNGESERVG